MRISNVILLSSLVSGCSGSYNVEVDDRETAPLDLEIGRALPGVLSAGEWDRFVPFELDDEVLIVTMTGTGDADLYVREGARPSEAEFDCRPYTNGSVEECRMEGSGTYYVGIHGYSPSSSYELSVHVEPGSGSSCSTLPGSGCGEEPGSPGAVVRWEVTEDGALYSVRGINAYGEAYMDATLDWAGDEEFTLTFIRPHTCAVTMNIAEATVISNTCEGEAAEAIQTLGLGLFTDMEAMLAEARDDADSNWVSRGCPWVMGGLGAVTAGFFSAGALWGASFAAFSTTGMIGAAVTGGAVVAIPAALVLAGTAGGCLVNGILQAPPLSECIADCSYGDTSCFDDCIDDELDDGSLANVVLLSQCVLACDPDDDSCFAACAALLPSDGGASGDLLPGEWANFVSFEVEQDGVLIATMTGTGDADLYVRKGAQPTRDDFDCRPYMASSNEECRMEGAGTYYVAIHGYGSPSSTYDLTVQVELDR